MKGDKNKNADDDDDDDDPSYCIFFNLHKRCRIFF